MKKKTNTTQQSDSLSLDEISANMKHDLAEASDSLVRSFASETAANEGSLNIRQVEDMMTAFMSKTRKISLDSVSDMLSNYDERGIISSKKDSLKKEG